MEEWSAIEIHYNEWSSYSVSVKRQMLGKITQFMKWPMKKNLLEEIRKIGDKWGIHLGQICMKNIHDGFDIFTTP